MNTLLTYEYGDLYHRYGWTLGVHRAPTGYQHPWLVVYSHGTAGYWSRAEAREAWRAWRDTGGPSAQGKG